MHDTAKEPSTGPATAARPAKPWARERIDRRTGDRRIDKVTSRLLLRALAIQRAFGPETALTLLLTSGVDESLTRTLLAVRSERRRRKARHDKPA